MGNRNKKYYEEKQIQLEKRIIKREALINAPRKPFTIALPLGAKKSGSEYTQVPIWKIALYIASFLLAIYLFLWYLSSHGLTKFYINILFNVFVIVVCVIKICKHKGSYHTVVFTIVGLFFVYLSVLCMLDIKYISNPIELELTDCYVYKRSGGAKSIDTYYLIGYTADNQEVSFNIAKSEIKTVSNDVIIDYLPNTETILQIKPILN